jgi:hypothetical protein
VLIHENYLSQEDLIHWQRALREVRRGALGHERGRVVLVVDLGSAVDFKISLL